MIAGCLPQIKLRTAYEVENVLNYRNVDLLTAESLDGLAAGKFGRP
jgi:hypothetical protein